MDEQSTQTRTADADSTRRGGFGWCFWASIFLPVYFLSSGPVLKLAGRGILPPVFIAVYAPIDALCYCSKPAQRFYSWYKNLWYPQGFDTLAK